MASPSGERYGRWKEKELGFEKEEFFGEEEGNKELEGKKATMMAPVETSPAAPAAMERKRCRKTMVMKECFSAA